MIRVNLDVILKERGISIREFSRMIEYNFEAVRRFHNNEAKRLPIDLIERSCRTLNIELHELIEYNRD